ncbi:MAG: aminotransferase class IV [Gemmatimonadota bacterium]
MARRGVSRGDRLLFHKTTARGVYESRRGDFGEGEGRLFDVLLWNEEGQVTEFTNGNAVACIDGVLRTPPLDCGLLAGTMRAELLAAGVIVEEVITLDDLRHADGLWLINSVRGWVPVTLTEEPGAS